MTNVEVFNKYRALCDTIGIKTMYNESSVSLTDIECVNEDIFPFKLNKNEVKFGEIQIFKQSKKIFFVIVKAKIGFIQINKLKFENKAEINSLAFVNGYLNKNKGVFFTN